MNVLRIVSALVVALALIAVLSPCAFAMEEGGESITLTIDRKTMPESIYYPGRFSTDSATVTVFDYVIRDYCGVPIDGFVVQTSSGRTEIPISMVKEIRLSNWIRKKTRDIDHVDNVVKACLLLTDGREVSTLMNADFGTIEGRTRLGDFFLKDPHTVRHLVFNRYEKPSEPPRVVKVEKVTPPPPPPADADGDGVPDRSDKCPDTPKGVKVDENGCPPDSDGDGVPDYKDKCPDTPKGAPVSSVGCWIIKGINFDYDKWDIKPEYYGLLDESVQVLKMNPTMKIEIQGHTDSIGSEGYNQTLSEKRAESSRDYFVSKGIEEERVSMRGLGELEPIVSNDTPEGRAQNRRIEIKILSR